MKVWNSTLNVGKGFKPRSKPMKRSVLKARSTSDSSLAKERIQALVRENAIERDGGCILRNYPETGACGGRRGDGELILQAEHLVTRANSATYGDMRNIVCICWRHHGYFKPQHSKLYWEVIERHLGPAHWAWLKAVEADRTPHKVDWKLTEIALKAELQANKKRI